jgi:hypothetical protein
LSGHRNRKLAESLRLRCPWRAWRAGGVAADRFHRKGLARRTVIPGERSLLARVETHTADV